MPLALVAIRKVRETEGLVTLWPEAHPLVTNPVAKAWLARPARTWTAEKDVLCTSLIAALRQHGELPAGFDPEAP